MGVSSHGFKKNDILICIDTKGLENSPIEIFGKYICSYIHQEYHDMIFLEKINGVFDASRFMNMKDFRKSKISKILDQ